jgi:L-alanine-DL-glutamate epimerase-like enolase superfamily enzyme
MRFLDVGSAGLMPRRLELAVDRFPLVKPFRIARGSVSELEVVTATIRDGSHAGRGECRPYPRYGETAASVTAAIEAVRGYVESGGVREGLLREMPAGAARNAIDCALWDLEAKAAGRTIQELLGLPPPEPVLVTYTIGLDTPEAMAAEAEACGRPLLKLKLGGAGDLERVEAVRDTLPDVRLVVDANEAWTPDNVESWSRHLAAVGVELIEQPLHADLDEALFGLPRPVPLCADESCHGADDLERLAPLYDMINIKLDKTGGLTAALELAERAEAQGMKIMVGCMMASSLAIAPAFVLAPEAVCLDLDAPLLLARDRDHAICYEGAMMQPPDRELWG